MEALLNPDIPIDVTLLDRVTLLATDKNNPSHEAQNILQQFSERNDSWTCIQKVLETETHDHTKFFELQIMKKFVIKAWNCIDISLKEEIRAIIMRNLTRFVISHHSEPTIRMADQVINEILKFDWPFNWDNFIDTLIEDSKKNSDLCLNYFVILKLFGEDITSSQCSLSKQRVEQIKSQFSSRFQPIFDLLKFIISNPDSPKSVLKLSLDIIRIYSNFVNSFMIFNNEFNQLIGENLLPNKDFTIPVTGIFGNIASQNPQQVQVMADFSVRCLVSNYGETPNFKTLNEKDVSVIATAFRSFFKFFNPSLPGMDNPNSWGFVIEKWMSLILSEIPNTSSDAFKESVSFFFEASYKTSKDVNLNTQDIDADLINVLNSIRPIFFHRFVPPFETIEVMNFDSLDPTEPETHLELLIDGDLGILNKVMSECLKNLVQLNQKESLETINNTLQAVSSSYHPDTLQSICYSISALVDIFPLETETSIMIDTNRMLLRLISECTDEEQIPIIAISYILMNIPHFHFLNSNWEQLEFLINFILDMMSSQNQTLQAVCSYSFVALMSYPFKALQIPSNDSKFPNSYIKSLANGLDKFLNSVQLSRHCIEAIFEGIGKLCIQDKGLTTLISKPILKNFKSIEPKDPPSLMTLLFFIRCLSHLVGKGNFDDRMLEAGTLCSKLNQLVLRLSQNNLISSYLYHTALETITNFFDKFVILNPLSDLISPLVNIDVLEAYKNAPPQFKEYSLLPFFSHCINSLATFSLTFEQVIEYLFIPTAQLISTSYDVFLEFKVPLASFIKNAFLYGTDKITQLPLETIDTIIGCTKWLSEHPYSDVSLEGLEAMEAMLKGFHQINESFWSSFSSAYSLNLTIFLFQLLVDTFHLFAFAKIVEIIQILFQLCPEVTSDSPPLMDSLVDLVPIFNMENAKEFLDNLQKSSDLSQFHELLKQFLVQTKQYNPNDPKLNKTGHPLKLTGLVSLEEENINKEEQQRSLIISLESLRF